MAFIGNSPYQGMVSGGNIQDGTVGTADLEDGAVVASKLGTYAVTTDKVANGAITAIKLAAGAAVPAQSGHAGQFLTTDGTTASWATVDTSQGDTAYLWGDHALGGYELVANLGSAAYTASSAYATAAQGVLADSALQSFTETDPVFTAWDKSTGISITESQISDFGSYQPAGSYAAAVHGHAISDVTGLQSALDGKVDDSQVLTNVPSGAVFTDTTYSVGNGGLTEINFTSALNAKLSGIEAGATADQTASEILTALKTVDGAGSGLDADLLDGQSGSYYTGYTDTAVANLVDTAPTTLNTLNELAAALGDDPNFATTISTSIGTKWTQDNTKISNWDTAYGWGNHASAGYQAASTALTTSTTFGGDVSGTYNAIVVANNSHTHNGSTIDDNSISAAELNVSGNGTAGQALLADGDGSFSWGSAGAIVTFPFYNSSGILGKIALIANTALPFFNSSGVAKNIAMTS